MPAEALADRILATRRCPPPCVSGTPSPPTLPAAPGTSQLGPVPSCAPGWWPAGRACDLPRGRPGLGAGGWRIKSPQGAPGGPLALLCRGAQPSPDLQILPVSSCLLRSPVCLLLSVLSFLLFLAGGQASRSSEEWGDPMDKSAQWVGHNLLPHWTSAHHVRGVGSRLHEWRELWQAGVWVLGL